MDHDKLVADVQSGMAFVTRFLPAIVKLRNAQIAKAGVILTAEDVEGLIEGFNVLRAGPKR